MKPYPSRKKTVMIVAALAAVFAFFLSQSYLQMRHRGDAVELRDFRSDFTVSQHHAHRPLYADDLGRKSQYLAFSRYANLQAGHFLVEFFTADGEAGDVQLEIAVDHGRKILEKQRVLLKYSARLYFDLQVPMKVEPRVSVMSGTPAGRVSRVRIVPLELYLPWKHILFNTLLYGWFAVLLLLTVDAALSDHFHWRRWLGWLFFSAAFVLVVSRAWVSEDAFITLRHVDNLLAGYGPVYNPGERVEGYTHMLWLAIVSLFRAVGLSAKGAVILPALLLTLVTLVMVLFRSSGLVRFESEKEWRINPALPLLLGTSGFIDFSTSGLETSLSFCLLAVYVYLLRFKDVSPGPTGWVLGLLALTRPDFIVFAGVITLYFLSAPGYRQRRIRNLVRLWVPLVILLGTVQVWRMGYYAAWFPNPFYAKSGAGSHWAQGLAYLWDLICGSPAAVIFVIAIVATILAWKRGDPGRSGRALVLASALVHGFFVVRGGGDFMHARFLLPALFLITLVADLPLKRPEAKKRRKVVPVLVVILSLLLVLALQVKPVQTVKDSPYHFGISDERYSYYGRRLLPVRDLFQHRLLFIWRTMGQNYAHLAQKINKRFTVAYANIGFLGYYAGPRVRVLDRLGLTDAVTARIRLLERRRPGHEKSAPLAYLIFRQVTFAPTPFPLWNQLADTAYGVLWDVSPSMLHQLQEVMPSGFKDKLDREISVWLDSATDAELTSQGDWIFFLSRQWVRYAPEKIRKKFRRRFDSRFLLQHSPSARWIRDHDQQLSELFQRIHGPLSLKRFLSNLDWCLRRPAGIAFHSPQAVGGD